ncbi:hypothetical protein BN1723_000230 [Verticillium longisporum]|uniref:Uncharacterized protein n=1 Tax=Verticillium longisporum TaxID=100787 RepID=A0A0G4KEL2_VERLO|nr:hypothetical protein BN1723_000230 [Verticillium longisporum]
MGYELHLLGILLEGARLEVGIQLARVEVAEVRRRLRRVVAAQAPAVPVLELGALKPLGAAEGEVSRRQRLARRRDGLRVNVRPLNRLAAQPLEKVIGLGLRGQCGKAKDGAVEGARVEDGAREQAANVVEVGLGEARGAVADDEVRRADVGVGVALRGEQRQRHLVPPANVEDGVGQAQLLDVVQVVLLDVAQREDALGRGDRGEEARDEAGYAGGLGGCGEGGLRGEAGKVDGRDERFEAREGRREGGRVAGQV